MVEKLDTNAAQQFDLNLIEAVKQNTVIYDHSHYNYKHYMRRAQTWKQISQHLGMPEQKCIKRWKSLRDKFAREMKLSTESRWRYFKAMSFLLETIRQHRESLLVQCGSLPVAQTNTSTSTTANTQVAQGYVNQQQQQEQQQQQHQQQPQHQQHAVVDIFPFNGAAAASNQTLVQPHVTDDSQLTATTVASATTAKETKTFYYEPALKRERIDDDQQQQQQQQQQRQQQQLQQHNDNMLNTIKILQNSMSQNGNPADQSFGVVVTDMLNTLGIRQKAEAKVHIIKYLTDMQLLAQHNKY